jgi:hypothetical protein
MADSPTFHNQAATAMGIFPTTSKKNLRLTWGKAFWGEKVPVFTLPRR